ncbi:hypothetical protein [Deinococcus actinosclerus]|uniref:hypothetical protein n=1 Tax=Deinococcus actinosclerus TaxID=1768108 RepID=UPI000A71B1B4
MTLRDLLRRGAAQLGAAGVPSPEVDARALLLCALNLSPVSLLTRAGPRSPRRTRRVSRR